MINLIALESPVSQAVGEEVYYSVNVLPWGGAPTNPSVKAYEGGIEVTATVLAGSPLVSGDAITLPKVKSLTIGKRYKIEVTFTSGVQLLKVAFEVTAV